ncbi:MAG: DUF1631 family protein [Gammaproteobacteria bacterium]|nr:DUF1631 family protein [Gammaproteobacteria bacterium]
MPNVEIGSNKLQANLVLQTDRTLSGSLSLLLDGSVELETAEASVAAGLAMGSFGTLCVPPEHNLDQSLQDTRVKIIGVNNDCVNFEFAAPNSDKARRYREIIDNGFSKSLGGTAPPSPARFEATDLWDSGTNGSAPRQATPTPRKSQRSPASVATAANAEYAKLLDYLKKNSVEQLARAIAPFLQDLSGHLLEESAKLGSATSGKNAAYEAAVALRNADINITRHFLEKIDSYFVDLTPHQEDDQLWKHDIDDIDDLSLVDLQEFEDFLLIDRMVRQGEEAQRVPLEALTLRMAELLDVDPTTLRNPIHVRQIYRAFQHGLVGAEIHRDLQSPIYDFFSERFVVQLRHFYAPFNKMLAKQGVLPDIEQEIAEKGSLLQRKEEFDRPTRPSPARGGTSPEPQSASTTTPTTAQNGTGSSELDDIHRQLGEQITGAMGRFTPVSLYKSVVDALNFKREAEGLLDPTQLKEGEILSGTWDGATVSSAEADKHRLADAQAIARALGALQRDDAARQAVTQSASLREYLAEHRQGLSDLRDSPGLTAESLNQLDMVDNLFDTIRSQLDVSNDLKPALGNLQIPMAKLALMDPRFFVDHGHTARMVVDRLSKLAASANFPNKALENRIGSIVDEIVADYETDSSVFTTALRKIDRLSEQQERALSRNIERVVKTQEGQERLSQARRAVARLIREALPDDNAPRALVDLIESGWRDMLVLTHVKQGPDSEGWAEQVRHFELLFRWLKEQQDQGLEDDQSVERSLEAESLLDLIGQQISAALPTNISHESVLEDLRDILSGTIEVETVQPGDALTREDPEPEAVRAKIDDLPRLRRWVKRVEQLEKDSWLTYRDKDGQKKRMQLAWISPSRDRYIFVNERGQKVADLSAIKLARQLSRGVQPPAPADALSVVDKSMYSTLEHVQKTLSFTRNHDSLTKLINRETFLDQMERALRHGQHRNAHHAVLYLNIDRFELVNEVYDRVSGDQVLLEFAKLLSQLHGKKSSSARIKADEFAILLLDRPIESAVEAAEKIRSDIEATSMDIDGENVSFTVSIGVSGIGEHTTSVEQVLEAARAAMQLAKQSGRNQVVRYQEDQNEAIKYKSDKNKKRQRLEEALATDRFVLRAQPIVQTAVSGRGSASLHYELLLGLKNKDGTLASPEDFINSAERYGFMTLVDRWVVREAFAWISELMDAQKVVPDLSINLSGASVTDDAFLDYLFEQISEFGVGTSKLCFEITETGTISNLIKAADFVRAFRNIGCKFSIDDFGTGLASHNYLRELPVDYVKIDGSFITGISENRNDYAMARSINDLAHFLGQQTIAESVENDAIVEKLVEIGVDYLQGWGVGKPKLLTEVTADLSTLEK